MKIAVVGDIIVDQYVHGEVTRISPEAPVPVLQYSHTEMKPGGAHNVYKNIQSLTDDVVMCTQNMLPPIKTRYMAGGHYLLRVDHDNRGGQWETSDSYKTADIVVVSDYDKGAIKSFKDFISSEVLTIVDPKRPLSFYRGAWCLKPNKKEFSSYAGTWDNVKDLASLMKLQRIDLNVEHLIVTLGEDGVAYCGPENKFYHFTSEAQDVFDVTGAGDTFTAVLAYGCSARLSMVDSIKLANKAAGIAVSHLGTYVVTKHDLGLTSHKPKTVFTNGCFDLLHPGHIEYLKQSRLLGDRLVVGLNSDRSVRELKGSDRPVNNQQTRKYMLEQFPFVDEVIIFDESTPLRLIKEVAPDVITKGGDYEPHDVVGAGFADVVILPYINGQSTTKIVERIRNDTATRDS